MKKNIQVVIPVVNIDLAHSLIATIINNTVLPSKVFLIDNSAEGFEMASSFTKIIVVRKKSRLGVNASWNLGKLLVDKEADYVSVLNDDILLKPHFFEGILNIFNKHKDCGVACPHTVTYEMDKWRKINRELGESARMKRREGWAFTINKKLFDKVPCIPDKLVTFCGDDWIYKWTRKFGYYWYKDIGNVIHHRVGVSVTKLGVRNTLRGEKVNYNQIVKKLAEEELNK